MLDAASAIDEKPHIDLENFQPSNQDHLYLVHTAAVNLKNKIDYNKFEFAIEVGIKQFY